MHPKVLKINIRVSYNSENTVIELKNICELRKKKIFSIIFTWTAVSAATIAGDPKPCVIKEKCVKGL